jgi:histidyl-tRNA synthetase
VIGAAEPAADVELLVMADQLLRELGVSDGVTLQLNTLGDSVTRDAWRQALVAHFEANRGDLSEESQDRLARNPLRILDSKDPRDRPIADAAPEIDASMSAEAGAFFEAVTKGLDAAGVAWTRNARLVRGLDYYRHTAFEFVTDRLGAQGTVLGGGRYDGLIETLGGPHTPAVGWAAGIERLAMLVDEPAVEVPEVAIVVEDDTLVNLGIWATTELRRQGLFVELISTGSPKKRFDKATKLSPACILSMNAYLLDAGQIASLRFKHFKMAPGQSVGLIKSLSATFDSRYKLQGDVWDQPGSEGRLYSLSVTAE